MKALAYGRVLGRGVFYGRGTPVKVLTYGEVLARGRRPLCARYPCEGIGLW